MSIPSFPAIPPYNPSYGPVPQITPFTYRDGVTSLNKLENMAGYITKVLVPYISDGTTALTDAVEADINNMIEQVNAAIDEVLSSSVTVQDSVVATLVNNPSSLTSDALEVLYAAKSVVDGLVTLTSTGRLSSATMDATWALKSDVTTLTDLVTTGRLSATAMDGRYAQIGDSYTKTASDAKYALIGASYSKSESDGKYQPKFQSFLWIGDSFVQGYMASTHSKSFSAIVSTTLGGAEHNYSVGGSGWIVGGESSRNFSQQLQVAHDEGQTPDVIFVGGGQNDIGNTDAAVSAAMQSFINLKNSLYPNVPMYVIPAMWKASAINPDLRRIYHCWVSTAQNDPYIITIDHAMEWLFGNTSLIAGDNAHPNDSGYAAYAQYILSALKGGSTDLKGMQTIFTMGSGMTADGLMVTVEGGRASIVGWVNKATNVAYLDTVAYLDIPGSRPSRGRYLNAYTNGGNDLCLLKLDVDGSLSVAAYPSGVTSVQIIIPPQSWPVGA